MTLPTTPHLRRDNLGYLLAKGVQRWNGMLREGFSREGFGEVRPSFGSVLIPLCEEDGLRLGELARRSRLTKQTMTTMVRAVEAAGFVRQRADPEDGRASRVWLTDKGRRFLPIAEQILEEIDGIVACESAPADLDGARRWLTSFAHPRGDASSDLGTTTAEKSR